MTAVEQACLWVRIKTRQPDGRRCRLKARSTCFVPNDRRDPNFTPHPCDTRVMGKIMIQSLRMLLIVSFSCACTQAATIEPVAAGLKLIEPFGVAFDRGGALYI